jgi:anti-anti-sigma regulatory factor
LIFNGVEIAARHLTSEPTSTTESLAQLARRFRTLTENGVLSIVHFVFGYDTDDEGVFERTMRFCLEARIGLPHFSLLTPRSGSALATTLAQEGRLLPNADTQGDGTHAVFRPRLMTPEALENGLRWTRQQVYRSQIIWQRVGGWNHGTLRHLLANHAQRRMFHAEPTGVYTEAMRLLSHLSQPIQVQERASFISTLHDAVGETRRHLQGALLRTRVIRDEPLKAVTLCLEGVLDASGAKEVLQRIHETIRAGHHKVVLDLKGLESISPTVITQFLEENAQALIALRGQVVFRHLRAILARVKENLGGVLPNAELFELVSEES